MKEVRKPTFSSPEKLQPKHLKTNEKYVFQNEIMFLKEEMEYIFRKEHLGQSQGTCQNVLLCILGRR